MMRGVNSMGTDRHFTGERHWRSKKWMLTACVSCKRTWKAWSLPSRGGKSGKGRKTLVHYNNTVWEMLCVTVQLIMGPACGPSDTFRRCPASLAQGWPWWTRARGDRGVPSYRVPWAQLESLDQIPASMWNPQRLEWGNSTFGKMTLLDQNDPPNNTITLPSPPEMPSKWQNKKEQMRICYTRGMTTRKGCQERSRSVVGFLGTVGSIRLMGKPEQTVSENLLQQNLLLRSEGSSPPGARARRQAEEAPGSRLQGILNKWVQEGASEAPFWTKPGPGEAAWHHSGACLLQISLSGSESHPCPRFLGQEYWECLSPGVWFALSITGC